MRSAGTPGSPERRSARVVETAAGSRRGLVARGGPSPARRGLERRRSGGPSPRTALLACLLTVTVGASGCRSDGARPAADLASEHSREALRAVDFDGQRALADLTRLEEIGPRRTGERGAGRARALIRRELRRAGFEARDVETPLTAVGADGERVEGTATHVVGRRDGASQDVILLVAPYDTTARPRPEDDADSASGASVLLELARVDHAVREAMGAVQPFTLVVAFVDGDGLARGRSVADPADAFPGSDAFARWWLAEAGATDLRLVVWIDRVGLSQVEVARDLHSNRAYRETFFAVGEARGLRPAFVPERPLSAPSGGHRALLARGLVPLVALVGDDASGVASLRLGASVADSTAPSPESLGAVGEATWWGLVELSDRLARIDAFRLDPLDGAPGGVALPGSEAPEAAAGEAPPPAEPEARPRRPRQRGARSRLDRPASLR